MFLQPKWNNALLEMFRIDYVGTSPYINCLPHLFHHRLGPRDRFLILSSDGLYQYFTNEEAVSEVELFIAWSPEGDPAQHLVEELLFRAAKKAGMALLIETNIFVLLLRGCLLQLMPFSFPLIDVVPIYLAQLLIFEKLQFDAFWSIMSFYHKLNCKSATNTSHNLLEKIELIHICFVETTGMDFHELLEIPQGDRRRYHDDVSIIVISLEGRIWRSCV